MMLPPQLPDQQCIPLPKYLTPPVPSVFTLEITSRCSHQCVGCGNVFSHRVGEMDLAAWDTIISQLKPFACALRITGGEPTLHQNFSGLLSLVDNLNIPFVLFTHGNWHTPEKILSVLTNCTNLRGVLFSLHALDAETFANYTGVDGFSQVIANIQMAAKAGLRVATNTLILKSTYQHLTDIAALAFSLGAATAAFGRYYGKPLPGYALEDEQLKTALLQIADLHKSDERIVLSNCVPACFLPEEGIGARGCTSGITHCTIGPHGEIRPCTHTPLTLGDIRCDDLQDVWQSDLLEKWRRRIPSACLRCAKLNSCRGGCRATAWQLGKECDPLMRTPLPSPAKKDVLAIKALDRPLLDCSIDPMPFGFALSGVGQYVTLSPASGSILAYLDGSVTMQTIQEKFGPAGVQLVGSLVTKRLVRLT